MSTAKVNLSIFIGGVSKALSEDDLLAYFGKFGPVAKITLQAKRETKTHSTEQSKKDTHRGCGVVVMGSAEAYQAVLQQREHKLPLCTVLCRPALSNSQRKRHNKCIAAARRKVFIGGLPKYTTKHDIESFFGGLVGIEEITLISKDASEASFCFLLLKESFSAETYFGKRFEIFPGIEVECQEALTPLQIAQRKKAVGPSQSLNPCKSVSDNTSRPSDGSAQPISPKTVACSPKQELLRTLEHRPQNLRFNIPDIQDYPSLKNFPKALGKITVKTYQGRLPSRQDLFYQCRSKTGQASQLRFHPQRNPEACCSEISDSQAQLVTPDLRYSGSQTAIEFLQSAKKSPIIGKGSFSGAAASAIAQVRRLRGHLLLCVEETPRHPLRHYTPFTY